MKALLIKIILAAFIVSTAGPLPSYAQEIDLPKPGVMVHLSPPLHPSMLKGMKVNPNNPFRFEFILDRGDSVETRQASSLQDDSTRLIKYFLASLTIPEKDLWVNLSPYEKDRIVPDSFGLTEMGRDLLAQDYMLKQVTASLIYPEDEVGKKFWRRVYEEASKKYGNTNIPVNTFNKVWIVPEKAVVYENAKAGTAYVVESKLKVMLEQDYLSLEKNAVGAGLAPALDKRAPARGAGTDDVNQIGSQIVREIVIPEITREINEGANFVQLRQVYSSLILATWYKKKIKDSILSKVYADRNKVQGIQYRQDDRPAVSTEQIYQQYLTAFKKGVYNYIKEDVDPPTQEHKPRKYFSGGWEATDLAMTVLKTVSQVEDAQLAGDFAQVSTNIQVSAAELQNQAMVVKINNWQELEGGTQGKVFLSPEKDKKIKFFYGVDKEALEFLISMNEKLRAELGDQIAKMGKVLEVEWMSDRYWAIESDFVEGDVLWDMTRDEVKAPEAILDRIDWISGGLASRKHQKGSPGDFIRQASGQLVNIDPIDMDLLVERFEDQRSGIESVVKRYLLVQRSKQHYQIENERRRLLAFILMMTRDEFKYGHWSLDDWNQAALTKYKELMISAKADEGIKKDELYVKLALERISALWYQGRPDQAMSAIALGSSSQAKDQFWQWPAVNVDKVDEAFDRWVREGGMDQEDHQMLQAILSGDDKVLFALIHEHGNKVNVSYPDFMTADRNGRTVYLKLNKPFASSQGDITVLRIKGARPKTNGGTTEVLPHQGDGFVKEPLQVESTGDISIKRQVEGVDHEQQAGQGVLDKNRADLEYALMKQGVLNKGYETDYPIASGLWRDRTFRGNPVGFVIAGMRQEDTRLTTSNIVEPKFLAREYINGGFLKTDLASAKEIFQQIGRSMRAYHDQGYFHRYPHLGNWGVELASEGRMRVIARDLDTTVSKYTFLDGDAARMEAAYRLIDLERIIADLTSHGEGVKFSLAPKFVSETYQPIVRSLLQGYFGDLEADQPAFERLAQSVLVEEFPGMAAKVKTQGRIMLSEQTPIYGELWKQLKLIADRAMTSKSVLGIRNDYVNSATAVLMGKSKDLERITDVLENEDDLLSELDVVSFNELSDRRTVLMDDIDNVLKTWDGAAIDMKKVISDATRHDFSLSAVLSLDRPEEIERKVEGPAISLVKTILKMGAKPVWSNAYGFYLKGVIWEYQGVYYFTALKAIDYAQIAQNTGGIDFNAAQMNLQINNAGEGIKFNLDPKMLAQLQHAPGFEPVIINIQPLVDLKSFLGIVN